MRQTGTKSQWQKGISYKFTCVPTCAHTHPHTETANMSQKHVSCPGGLDSKCARRELFLKCLCSAHWTLHVVSTQVDSVHFSCLLQFQKCLHLFSLLTLKNSPLTQKNLIKRLPVLFVTHSWNMAPAVLISARSLPQAQIGFLQCPKKELKLEILCNHSAPPSYALTMYLEPFFFFFLWSCWVFHCTEGFPQMWCMDFSLKWLLLLGGTGPSVQGLRSRGRDLVAPRHVASSWTSNPTLQADSYSQYHRGNANFFFFF